MVLGISGRIDESQATLLDAAMAPLRQAGVRLSVEEWTRTRCLLVDARKRVIASSDDKGVLQEVLPLKVSDPKAGAYRPDADTLVAYALTPGYETYEGMGWYGVIVRKRAGR